MTSRSSDQSSNSDEKTGNLNSIEVDTCPSSRFESYFENARPGLNQQPKDIGSGGSLLLKTYPQSRGKKSDTTSNPKRQENDCPVDHSYGRQEKPKSSLGSKRNHPDTTVSDEPLQNSLEKLTIHSHRDEAFLDIREAASDNSDHGSENETGPVRDNSRPEPVEYQYIIKQEPREVEDSTTGVADDTDITVDRVNEEEDLESNEYKARDINIENIKVENSDGLKRVALEEKVDIDDETNEDKVEQFEIESLSDVIETDGDGDTSLHLAIIHNVSFYYVVSILFRYILRHGRLFRESINVGNNLRQTPLHLAVLMERLDLARLLVAVGARVNARDRRLRTPILMACELERIDILKGVLDAEYRIVSSCLDTPDSAGKRCVHVAVANGNVEMLKVLVEHGADVNKIERKSGKTALHLAAETGNEVIVRYLVSLPDIDGDIRMYGPTGCSALELAYMRGHRNLVSLLRQVTTEPNRKRRRVEEDDQSG